MSVQVIDVKTGKVKTMPEKYAQILLKMKRARWPDQVVEVAPVVEPVAPASLETPVLVKPTAAVSEEAEPKKRGRKPKAQE
ncbi:hypothetical protein D9M68_900730 [compost metagenome]